MLLPVAATAKQQHFICHTYAAAAAFVFVLLCACCRSLHPTPARLPIEGPSSCYTMVLQLLLLLPISCYSCYGRFCSCTH